MSPWFVGKYSSKQLDFCSASCNEKYLQWIHDSKDKMSRYHRKWKKLRTLRNTAGTWKNSKNQSLISAEQSQCPCSHWKEPGSLRQRTEMLFYSGVSLAKGMLVPLYFHLLCTDLPLSLTVHPLGIFRARAWTLQKIYHQGFVANSLKIKSLDYLSRKDIECTGARYLTEPKDGTSRPSRDQVKHSQGLSRNGLPRLPLLSFSHQILIMETLASILL